MHTTIQLSVLEITFKAREPGRLIRQTVSFLIQAQMQQHFFNSSYRRDESHRIAYTEWGDPGNPRLLFCSHGLSRNGRDFDELARVMSDQYHVVCPDYPGRGLSAPLANSEDYDNQNYLLDSINLLQHLDKPAVDWVGTSMGGIIGMFLASQDHSPVQKLVLNDVGTHISQGALEEIARYLGPKPIFRDRAEARHYFESVYIGFGPMTARQVDHLTEHGIWPLEEGGFQPACDHRIIDRFVAGPLVDVDLWPFWSRIKIPTLVIRGVHSRLLTAEEMHRMAASRESVTTVEFERCGHAPSLMHPEQIQIVREWLLE